MKPVFSIFVLALVLCSMVAADLRPWQKERFVEKWYQYQLKDLMTLLSKPQMPQRYLTGKENFMRIVKHTSPVLQFSWSSCGQADDPVKIKSLSVQPDPIAIPGVLTVSVELDTAVDVVAPLQVDMNLQKKIAFIWVTVPCVDNVGSCSYNDFCSLLPTTCPPDFVRAHVPCNCPAAKGSYTLSGAQIEIPSIPLPEWLSSGDYKVNLKGSNLGKELFCLDLSLSLD